MASSSRVELMARINPGGDKASRFAFPSGGRVGGKGGRLSGAGPLLDHHGQQFAVLLFVLEDLLQHEDRGGVPLSFRLFDDGLAELNVLFFCLCPKLQSLVQVISVGEMGDIRNKGHCTNSTAAVLWERA